MARNILVADDDRTIAHLIREIIERRGSTALVAYDGEQALKIFNIKEYPLSHKILIANMVKARQMIQ